MIISPALCTRLASGHGINSLQDTWEASVSWYVCTVAWQSLRRVREPQVVRTNPFSSFVGLLANKEFPRSPIRSRGQGTLYRMPVVLHTRICITLIPTLPLYVYIFLIGRVSNATNQWCPKFNVAQGVLHAAACN